MPVARSPRPSRARATSKTIPAGSDSEFTFKSSKGVITVPSIASVEMTFDILEAVVANNNLAVIVKTVQNCSSPEAIAVVRQLGLAELDKFYTEWSQFAGVSVGESAAS